MVASLTVVGYGDDHSIYVKEDLEHNTKDMVTLMVLILFGTVSFSKMAGGMRLIFQNNKSEISFD